MVMLHKPDIQPEPIFDFFDVGGGETDASYLFTPTLAMGANIFEM